jgi:CheB methylesterase
MAEILGRCTSMPVSQIENGMLVEPDHVYVIRPGYTVTVKDCRLHLGEPVEKRGHRRPIDDFFRSLAGEQREDAIAVILSGTGTNGSAGAQAIKARTLPNFQRSPCLRAPARSGPCASGGFRLPPSQASRPEKLIAVLARLIQRGGPQGAPRRTA